MQADSIAANVLSQVGNVAAEPTDGHEGAGPRGGVEINDDEGGSDAGDAETRSDGSDGAGAGLDDGVRCAFTGGGERVYRSTKRGPVLLGCCVSVATAERTTDDPQHP